MSNALGLRPDRAEILGTTIDRLDMPQTVARIEDLIERRGFAQHVCVNAAKIIASQDDPEMRGIINRCELVSADGQSVVWASRLLGDALPTRVAGIDLMQELLALAERRGLGVYILGASPPVLDRACARIRERHPALRLVGARDGYFDESESEAVAREVAAARPDILFVAISSPKKEYWLGRYGRDLGVPFVMGVGGSVDVIAGITRRAPRPFQILGLEWAYRLAQEPSRLWRRYLVTNSRFVVLLVRQLAGRRRRIPA
jgi:N-acetylglucosaminyldiphosphoundecaprenol N-acetyl-beta-D-mannosaminyltransferase